MQMETVLVVDDSGMARGIVKHCLKILGHQDLVFLEAGNGREALDRLEKSVSLVITDLNMPEMGGAELLRRIKARPSTVHVPVIVVSSTINQEQSDLLRQQGAGAVVRKPLSPPALHRAIEDAFKETQGDAS